MIKRGDIYFIRDTRQSIGSEQKADRPAVIVSNDANNKHSGVYEVVYMTTQPKTDLPTHFITSSALRTSTVLCEQISSVYEERIGEWIGTLTPEEIKDTVYSGCYAKVCFNFYPYSKAQKGIACGLDSVLKMKDGENLGGHGNALGDWEDEIDQAVTDSLGDDYGDLL